MHGKEEIKADSKIYETVREGNSHRLLIAEVFPEDGGLYVCEAYNEYGDTDTSCLLTVQGKGVVYCRAEKWRGLQTNWHHHGEGGY